MDGKNGFGAGVGGNSNSFKNNPTSKKDDGASDRNETSGLDDDDNVVPDNDDDIIGDVDGSGKTMKGDERLVYSQNK